MITLEEIAPSVTFARLESQKDEPYCKAIVSTHYKKTLSIFQASTLSSNWKTHNGRAEIFSHYGLDGDQTIKKWSERAQSTPYFQVVDRESYKLKLLSLIHI